MAAAVDRADLDRLARKLKAAGNGRELKKEFNKALRTATKPAQNDVKRGLGRYLPSGYVPDLKRDISIRSQSSVSGRRAGVAVVVRSRQSRLGALDKGILRHPLFGDRTHWYGQKVKAGFFSEPMRAAEPTVTRAVADAIEHTLNQQVKV